MELVRKNFHKRDIPFFQELIECSPEWQKEEVSSANILPYLEQYQDGIWSVWYKNNKSVGISYHIEAARSNLRPWLGTILVDPDCQRQGVGKNIVDLITFELGQKGHKVVYAAVPVEQHSWVQFLSTCGFEQYKIEKENDRMYLMLVKPIE